MELGTGPAIIQRPTVDATFLSTVFGVNVATGIFFALLLIAGATSILVYGGSGKLFAGARSVPTNTMFQFDPVQLPSALLRVSHCCWLPDLTCPSTLESARKPPLDQPPSSSTRSPRMCMRRIGAACDTAHRSKPPLGTTDMFSTARQKFSVAFPFLQRASARMPPLMTTSSGEIPRPDTCV